MAYETNITQVGANEYPLIRVLSETIFAPFPLENHPNIEPGLRDADIQLLGHLEGNPLGFIVAQTQDDVLRIAGCGVLKEYRRQGIGGRLLEWIEKQADARQRTVEIVVPAVYQEMGACLRGRGYRSDSTTWTRAPRPIDSVK